MLLNDLLDFVFPRTCAACGKRLSLSEQDVCEGCLKGLHRIPYLPDGRHGDIERLFWGLVPIERATSLFYYDSEAVRNALHCLKYKGRPSVGDTLGYCLATSLISTDFFEGVTGLVSVPLHWHRCLKRGYNQCDYIVQGIHRATGIPKLNGVVRRIKDNPSQTHLDHVQRRDNVRDIFSLTEKGRSLLKDQHVLLVDDTLTTGSTLLSCARELVKAKARVSVCTVAYAGELVHLDQK